MWGFVHDRDCFSHASVVILQEFILFCHSLAYVCFLKKDRENFLKNACLASVYSDVLTEFDVFSVVYLLQFYLNRIIEALYCIQL